MLGLHTRLALNACRRTSSLRWVSSKALEASVIRTDWTREEIQNIYDMPLMELVYKAASIHRQNFNPREVQQCTLLSIKTGGCVEDCKYCSQSSRYKTPVKATPTLKIAEVVETARRAKEAGSTRFCMGAAWRDVGDTKDRKAFASVLEMVRQVKSLDLEVCCTLGMLTANQAKQLKDAGLTAYNHNLDTSREFYPSIITTRTYEDRLQTVENVRNAGISVCCGGILGLGEKAHDRVGLLHTLSTLPEHPESVPINALVPIEGTPLAASAAATANAGSPTEVPPVSNRKTGARGSTDKAVAAEAQQISEAETAAAAAMEGHGAQVPTAIEMTRMIATARCLMPRTMVRLSAGRMNYTDAEQGLMMLAGANSIFYGDTLLTAANPEQDRDRAMFNTLGLQGKAPFTAPLDPILPEAEHAPFLNQDIGIESIHVDTVTRSGDASRVTVTKVKQQVNVK